MKASIYFLTNGYAAKTLQLVSLVKLDYSKCKELSKQGWTSPSPGIA
jgi:hypothetical protein